jgi:N-methylhydantoinase B
MKATSLTIFHHLFASVAEEMGVTLGRAAYSPNIKERLDFSCALFLGDGRMLAQAAHIPVHLGAMPASARAAIEHCAPFLPGDLVILNDPYLGGTHLPDITLVSPVFFPDGGANWPGSVPQFFVASRAHHADVGGMSPGSMPLSSEIYQEGIVIPPLKLAEAGRRNEALWSIILRNVRTPAERDGDLAAQVAAHRTGEERLKQIVDRYGLARTVQEAEGLIRYGSRLSCAAVSLIPDGCYEYKDYLDDDGQGNASLVLRVTVTVSGDHMTLDFSGTSSSLSGNMNAVPAIVESAVVYCLRCLALELLRQELPINQGVFDPLEIIVERGSLLNPQRPHAVAAGNVETSQRIVDVVYGALAGALPQLVPAASQGTMNNVAFGSLPGGRSADAAPSQTAEDFAYYETIGGGIGAGPTGTGGHGMHVHMSNTRNTPIEALEFAYPLLVRRYAYRPGSGGGGKHRGGNGLVREIRFQQPVRLTLVSERRRLRPYGLAGGAPGESGRNLLIRDSTEKVLPGKVMLDLKPGDVLRVETPGGGGWGKSDG